MAKAYYLPSDDANKCSWLNNFSSKIPTYAAAVAVTPAELASLAEDNLFWTYVCDARNQNNQYGKDWTAYKNGARNGLTLGDMPTPPVLGAPPAMVLPNIFGRITQLVARIKQHPGYTDAMGQDLDIIGEEQTVDANAMKPVLKLTLQAGHPNVGWKKQGMDAIEIHVDRGNGLFVYLANDTVPDYLDTLPLPAPGAGAVWRYKGIYRLNDGQVGQWSDVASISVMN